MAKETNKKDTNKKQTGDENKKSTNTGDGRRR